MGGPSAEHEVSLETGRTVLDYLDKSKYNLLPVAITKSGKWLLPQNGAKYLKPPPPPA